MKKRNMENVKKNFDGWNVLKKRLDQDVVAVHIHRGDVWWTSIGENIGREENGKGVQFERPVVVIGKYSDDTFFALPLTRQGGNTPYRFKIMDMEGSSVYAILSQPRVLDRKRVLRFVCKIPRPIYKDLVENFKNTIEIPI